MAKKDFDLEDDGVELDLGSQKSRKLNGDDGDPVDADTGQHVFEDIAPRFVRALEDATEKPRKKKPAEQEADEEELDDAEDDSDEDDEPEVDTEKEDEPEVEDLDEDEEESAEEEPNAKFRKRLARERRLREEERENNRELKDRLSKLERTLEIRANDDTFAQTSADLTRKLADLRAKLKQAKEDGETEAELTLTDELIEVKAELRQKDAEHKRAKETAKQQTEAAPSAVVARKATQWIRKHQAFNADPVFAEFVRAVDRKLGKQGLDPETDEFYTALDKEVRKRYPEEYPAAKPQRRQNPPTLNPRREGTRKPPAASTDFATRNGKVRVTSRQLENMAKFGFNPKDPNDVRDYVLNNRKA